VKKIVLATGDIVKRSVDDQTNDVLTELQTVTSESSSQAESVQEAFELAVVSMESFHTRSRELLDKGRTSDMTRAARELHERAQELLNNDVTAVHCHPPRVTFTPADVTQVKRFNLIGRLAVITEEQPDEPLPKVARVETELEEDRQELKQATDTAAVLQEELIQATARERELQMQLDKMKDELQMQLEQQSRLLKEQEMKQREIGHLVERLPEGKPVTGVTSPQNHLYILRDEKCSEQVEVCDINSYQFQRYLTVPKLGSTADIVACAHNRCAYISDWEYDSVDKIALSDDTVT